MEEPSEEIRSRPADLPVIISSDRGTITLESEHEPYRLELDGETARALAAELTKHALLLEAPHDEVLGVRPDGSRPEGADPGG